MEITIAEAQNNTAHEILARLPTAKQSAAFKLPASESAHVGSVPNVDAKVSPLRKWRVPAIAVGAGLILLLANWVYGLFTTESTDDAFVAGHVHNIGARVAGTVIEVPVQDNQIVKKGDVLLRLDPKDFEVALKTAKANAVKFDSIAKRWKGNEINPFELVQRTTDIAAAEDADAALEKAELQLQYSTMYAPADGKIGNKTVETGEQVQPGQALMALVEQNPWIVANFKESQVTHLRQGQPVKISVDAISGESFAGAVDSLAPGSGATFALLPPDNATGNFTKIVQRIPVKIVFDSKSLNEFSSRLAPGMSTIVSVKVK